MIEKSDLVIKTLGPCRIDSPMKSRLGADAQRTMFEDDAEGLLYHDLVQEIRRTGKPLDELPAFEVAGPRETIYFDPSKTRCGIVTCGGLCPGVNDVVRTLVLELWYIYGVRRMLGFRYGYQGFIPRYGHDTLELNPQAVHGLQDLGGTVLGSSRGRQDPVEMVDCLERLGVNILFVIGGDGTLRGAQVLAEEVESRGCKIAIVAIPKTIDNDIMYVGESFGFHTAYAKAVEALQGAHTEATGAPNGIGLVKLMGRHSGFIACHAALAMSDVNFVLIPEVPFELEGEGGFLNALRQRLELRKHAVIVVAEGAGQDLLGEGKERDASGNIKLGDIGQFLKERILAYFAEIGMEVTLKYIDPSYIIRSVRASAEDSIYCMRLAQMAVHAAMCGKTEMAVGCYHGHFVHIPIPLAVSGRKQVDPNGGLWLSVLESTGQPPEFK